MDNSVIARSGWLMRRVSGKDWRKNWIELYRDGYLKYYENDYSPNPEDVINMPTECISIKTGLQVEESYNPPNGYSGQCVFAVSAPGNKRWIFCAESPDDMRAWQLALEQARLLISRPPHLHHHHHHLTSPHLNHPSMIHSLRLASAGLTGPTGISLDDYHHRIDQYTQQQAQHLHHLINSRSLALTLPPPGDLRSTTYLNPHLRPPPPPVSTAESTNNPTTSSSTTIFPIPPGPPPRLPCFNFNFTSPVDSQLTRPRLNPLFPTSQPSNLPPNPLTPTQSRIFQPPYSEHDLRNLNLDVFASLTSPDARLSANRILWSPFIWW